MTDNQTTDAWAAALLALMWLRWNHSDIEAVRLAFPDIDAKAPAYKQEKLRRWGADPLQFFGTLDRERKRAFVAGLQAKYGPEAERWLRV